MFEIRESTVTGSTNDDAAALLGEAEHAGAVLVADFQRAGRGRRARAWIAPPGSSLLFTAILPAAVRPDAMWAVPFWTALGVADGIEAAAGVRVDLQWPNDLLLGGRKVGGILCVSRVNGEHAWIGCGTGVNVVRPEADAALEALDPPPAFLGDVAAGTRRRDVLDAILAAHARRIGELDDPEGIARAWEVRAGLAGTAYRILIDGEATAFDARAVRIAGGGALVVVEGGRERHISLADARVLRG